MTLFRLIIKPWSLNINKFCQQTSRGIAIGQQGNVFKISGNNQTSRSLLPPGDGHIVRGRRKRRSTKASLGPGGRGEGGQDVPGERCCKSPEQSRFPEPENTYLVRGSLGSLALRKWSTGSCHFTWAASCRPSTLLSATTAIISHSIAPPTSLLLQSELPQMIVDSF